MKKFFSFVMTVLMATAMSFAQGEGKVSVAVEDFSYNSSIGTNWVEVLRGNIISGITKTGRVDVVDTKTLSSLPEDKEERMASLGEMVDIVLTCHFGSMETGVDKNGKYYYCNSSYTITLTDAKGGAVISTTPYKHSWDMGDTQNDAINSCLGMTTSDMKKFVDDNIKTEAVIKQLDQVDAKKGVKTAYISAGSNAGIVVGQMFDIMEEVEIAGEKATKKIGDAKAQEVASGTLTLIKVSKGGMEIKKAFDAGHKLTVITRAKKDVFGTIDKLLE